MTATQTTWTAQDAIAALIAITHDYDASDECKEQARGEILVILGAARGKYTVEERRRNRRHLRAALDEMNALPAPKVDTPLCIEQWEQKRRNREDFARRSAARRAKAAGK
ncbi:MAG TPA: hypothetical protein VJU59_09155 [Paraburkholderia sp.]|uniref:hypothetical protein n=1 Tax=Paraburkholderia sp. TaxID=1926495 RepID=UPI002B4920CF|nr:hypothetical protein [Paraburkholderia sp.]HKR39832.1 hypothetical protein [Paraburkholderia sp.]